MESDTKRIAKNTVMLYIRQLFCMGLSFYTVRVVLDVLGVEDYGIYNVIAGAVMLLSFLTTTMSSATQRFFSFALGRKDDDMLKEIFGTNVVIYLAIAFIAILLFETVGLWFVHFKLNIPSSKISEARLLYQFAIAGFLASLVSSPYIAIIIAHEEMNLYAYISILDACLKLGAIIALPHLQFAKLPLYGALLALEALTIAVVYCIYCAVKYKECSLLSLRVKRSLLKEIIDFTWWTLFGSVTTVSRYQAITILVNQFFNPAVVAARAIALNISNTISIFSSNFNTGLYPPIIKAWAKKDRREVMYLIFIGSKICFLLLYIVVFPLTLNMQFVLQIWLKDVPEYTSLFSILAVVEASLFLFCQPLATAARAVGKMKLYELPLGILQLLIFPISYFFLFLGFQAYITFTVAIIIVFFMVFVRLMIIKKMMSFPVKDYMNSILIKEGVCVFFTYALALPLHAALNNSPWYTGFLLIPLDIMIALAGVYLLCLNKNEKLYLSEQLKTFLKKIP